MEPYLWIACAWMYALGGWLLFSAYAVFEPVLCRDWLVRAAFVIWPISLPIAWLVGMTHNAFKRL